MKSAAQKAHARRRELREAADPEGGIRPGAAKALGLDRPPPPAVVEELPPIVIPPIPNDEQQLAARAWLTSHVKDWTTLQCWTLAELLAARDERSDRG